MSVAGFNHSFISMDGQLRLLTFSSIHFYYVEMLTIWILHSAAWQSSSPKDGIGTQGLPTTPVVKRVIRLDVPVDKFPNVCMSIPLQNCLFSTLISCNNSFYTPSNLSSIILLAEFSDLVGTPWKESKPWLNVGFTFGAVALSRILLRYAYLLSNYTPPHLYNFFSQLLLLYRKKSLKRNPDMSTLKNHCMCWWRQSFQRI